MTSASPSSSRALRAIRAFFGSLGRPGLQRALVRGSVRGHGPAVDPVDQALPLQVRQITADGFVGDAQLVSQSLHSDSAVTSCANDYFAASTYFEHVISPFHESLGGNGRDLRASFEI